MSVNSMKKENGNISLKNRLLQLTLVVLSLTVGMQAQDTQHCSNATLHGSYGFHATGTGTNIGPVEFPGTYSVSPDCTVTDTWGPPINSTHVSAIVDQGKGYFIMNVSPSTPAADTLNNGEARRQ